MANPAVDAGGISPRPKPPTKPDVPEVRHKLRMVLDAICRVNDNLNDNGLEPAACAYIDGQLEKCQGWLASARAIVVAREASATAARDAWAEFDRDAEATFDDLDARFELPREGGA